MDSSVLLSLLAGAAAGIAVLSLTHVLMQTVPYKKHLVLPFILAVCVLTAFGLEILVIEKKLPPALEKLAEHVIVGLVAGAILEIVLHYHSVEYLRTELTGAVRSLFAADPKLRAEIIRDIPAADQKQFLESVITKVTDEQRGPLIYSKLLAPAISGVQQFRRRYDYDIEVGPTIVSKSTLDAYRDIFATDDEGVRAFTDKHDLIRQTITHEYQRHAGASPKGEIHFDFSVDALDESFRNPGVLFREYLQLAPDLVAAVHQLEGPNLHKFVADFLQLRVFPPGSTANITWEADWADGGNGQKFIRVKLVGNPNVGACTVAFRIPQLKTLPYFIVQIAEPTLRPIIEFRHNDNNVEVVDFPFFATKVIRTNQHEPRITRLTVEDETWVFPRSGVLFAWRPK